MNTTDSMQISTLRPTVGRLPDKKHMLAACVNKLFILSKIRSKGNKDMKEI